MSLDGHPGTMTANQIVKQEIITPRWLTGAVVRRFVAWRAKADVPQPTAYGALTGRTRMANDDPLQLDWKGSQHSCIHHGE